MARWRLRNTHYLNVPGTEWEYSETNRDTGKRAREVFTVPLHLDPANPADQNYPGDIIVAHEGKGDSRDIIFLGEPTPDMEPLDEEAETISASLRQKWEHPIDSLPANGGMNQNEMAFMQNMMKTFSQSLIPNTSSAVDPEAFAKLQAQVAELASENASMKAAAVRR